MQKSSFKEDPKYVQPQQQAPHKERGFLGRAWDSVKDALFVSEEEEQQFNSPLSEDCLRGLDQIIEPLAWMCAWNTRLNQHQGNRGDRHMEKRIYDEYKKRYNSVLLNLRKIVQEESVRNPDGWQFQGLKEVLNDLEGFDENQSQGTTLQLGINEIFQKYDIPMNIPREVITSNQSKIKEAKIYFCTSNSIDLRSTNNLFGKYNENN